MKELEDKAQGAQLTPEQEVYFWMLCYALRDRDNTFINIAFAELMKSCPVARRLWEKIQDAKDNGIRDMYGNAI